MFNICNRALICKFGNVTIRGNKPDGTGERRKTKKISRQNKTIQTKIGHSKNNEKILPASRGGMHGRNPTTR